MDSYRHPPISNGNPDEQALIRRWWHEQHAGRGLMVWEYYLRGCYLDGMWFPEALAVGAEEPGLNAPSKFPIAGKRVTLCEAKVRLTPELIGQALVYASFARGLGALVERVVIFAKTGSKDRRREAKTSLQQRKTSD
jgi:hypothetical protein